MGGMAEVAIAARIGDADVGKRREDVLADRRFIHSVNFHYLGFIEAATRRLRSAKRTRIAISFMPSGGQRALPLEQNIRPRERRRLDDFQTLRSHPRVLLDGHAEKWDVINSAVMVCRDRAVGGPRGRLP